MKKYLMPRNLSDTVLMIGVYWKNNAPGGVSSVVNTYAENFETLNYTVTAGILDESKIKKLVVAVVGLSEFVWKLLTNKSIKIIHVQGSHGASYDRKKIFVKIAKLFGKKVVWHMHASSFQDFYNCRKDKNDIVRTLNIADVIIGLSKSYYDFFSSIGVDEKKLLVLNNIVPRPTLNERKRNWIDCKRGSKLHFLFLGEISQRKGVFDLMQVMMSFPDIRNNIEVRIGGNGETKKLIETIKTANLGKCVKFEGWVGPDKKVELLNWADVYILPSYNEGLPISILEAMSYKCPIISSPVGGIPEVVTKDNGILVEPGNIDALADAIKFFLEKPDMVKECGNSSGVMVEQYYPDEVFSALRLLYCSLLNS